MKKLILIALGMTTLLFSNVLFAHTKLKESHPANDSAVSSVKELKLVFNGKVKLMKVTLKNEAGEKVKTGFKLSPGAKDTFIIPLTSLSKGNYLASWVAMGKETHKMKGDISFKVVEAKQ